MSQSLREQLLKAGLVSEQQAQRAEREQREQRYAAPRGKKKPVAPSPQQLAAQQAAAAKAAKDAELNRKQQEKLDRRAKYAEIRQLVEAHRVPRVDTEDFYNFAIEKEIHRVAVTPALRAQLIAGTLAIVRCDGRFAFVPADTGTAIGDRIPKALLHLNKPAAAPAEDDPYKEYVVPDDLIW